MTDHKDVNWVLDDLKSQTPSSRYEDPIPRFKLAVDTIETLVKERDDLRTDMDGLVDQHLLVRAKARRDEARRERDALAAVVEKVREWNVEHGFGWAEGIDEILSTAPADALAEHDARLIEGMAEAYENEKDGPYFPSIVSRWLRERARLIREGGKK